MNSRIVSFANSAVAIEWDGALSERMVDFLFHDVPENCPDQPHVTFSLSTGKTENEILLSASVQGEARRGPYGEVALCLMERVSYHLADRSHGGAVFHAACLSLENKALLLAGTSGAGKSSLAVWLASQGFHCLTDEIAFIPDGVLECWGFTRPIHLKPPAEKLFPWLLENASQQLRPLQIDPPGWLIPPAALGADPQALAPTLHGIIFPHFTPGVPFQCKHLSKASTAVTLAGTLVNARNLPDHGFPQLMQLARAVPAYQITYDNFEPISEALRTIFW